MIVFTQSVLKKFHQTNIPGFSFRGITSAARPRMSA
jgi:hypothetical protein